MFHNHDHLETPAHSGPELLSANRPPQLNQTVCGCRCGRGSGNGSVEGGDGGSNDDDTASTLVASEESDAEDAFPASPNEAVQHARVSERPSLAPRYLDDFQARVEMLIGSPDHLQRVSYADAVPHQRGMFHDYGDADSMKNEPGSDIHSVVPSEVGSIRGMSPGPGVGAWTWTEEHLPMDYHFLVTPLRLTPQHQYCRGLVASHLVLRDDVAFQHGRDGFYEDYPRMFNHLRRA